MHRHECCGTVHRSMHAEIQYCTSMYAEVQYISTVVEIQYITITVEVQYTSIIVEVQQTTIIVEKLFFSFFFVEIQYTTKLAVSKVHLFMGSISWCELLSQNTGNVKQCNKQPRQQAHGRNIHSGNCPKSRLVYRQCKILLQELQ